MNGNTFNGKQQKQKQKKIFLDGAFSFLKIILKKTY